MTSECTIAYIAFCAGGNLVSPAARCELYVACGKCVGSCILGLL